MKTDKYVQGNKVIAEGMGAVAEQWYPESDMYNLSGVHYVFPTSGYYPDNVRHHSDQLLKFHSSWEWLMNAVEYVESMIHPESPNHMFDSGEFHDMTVMDNGVSLFAFGFKNGLRHEFEFAETWEGYDKSKKKETLWKCLVEFFTWCKTLKNE